ncbi:MAG: hypothetical protein LBC12_01530 [Nitrososphaerota archaeon]|jgi:hypothetical protein|nr:hypothetical protein [Nitrososphaerota archaeon]
MVTNIPDNKNITLKSSSNTEFSNIFSTDDQTIIIISGGGELKLDGIIVTHVDDARGGGVYVSRGSTLRLSNGKISGNNGGVSIGGGVFVMSGGKIFNNTPKYSNGGGVYSNGHFVMSGGEISGNSAVEVVV